MTCLQSTTTSVPSLLTAAFLLISMGFAALLAVWLGVRAWAVYQRRPRVEGSRARAIRGLLSGVVTLAIMATYIVNAWNHCSLDNRFQPAGVWGVYVAILALLYYLSTLHASPVRHAHPAAIPGMVSRVVHDHPLQSLMALLVGTFTAAVPFLLLFRVLLGAFVPLVLGWMVLFLAQAAVAMRWLRQGIRRAHEQGLPGFLWPLHVPAIFWVWACGFGPTTAIGFVLLVVVAPTY